MEKRWIVGVMRGVLFFIFGCVPIPMEVTRIGKAYPANSVDCPIEIVDGLDEEKMVWIGRVSVNVISEENAIKTITKEACKLGGELVTQQIRITGTGLQPDRLVADISRYK